MVQKDTNYNNSHHEDHSINKYHQTDWCASTEITMSSSGNKLTKFVFKLMESRKIGCSHQSENLS